MADVRAKNSPAPAPAPASVSVSTSGKWVLLAVLAGSHFLVHFQRLSTGVMGQDLMQSLGIGTMTLGWVAASYFYTYALFQVPCGMLADIWGVRPTLTLFMVVAALGSFAVSYSGSAVWVSLGRAMTGAGLASVFVVSLKALGQRFGRAEFAGVVGLFQTVGHVGAVAASAPLVVMSATLGWRGVYRVLGLLGLVVAFVTWATLGSYASSGAPETLGREAADPATPRKHHGGFLRELAAIFANRDERRWLLLLSGAHFMKLGPVVAFQGLWGSCFLTATYNLSRIQAGSVVMMVAVGYIVGGPLAGYLSDQVMGRRRPIIIGSSLLYAVSWVPLVAGKGCVPGVVLYLTVLAMGLAGGSLGVMTFAVVREVFSRKVTGTANSLVNTVGTLAVSIYQPLMGLILSATQGSGLPAATAYQMAFLPCLLSGVGVLCASVAMRETLGSGPSVMGEATSTGRGTVQAR
ncbi:MAG: MFS transporter [Bacillota bacterium]|nr:MFS transporter [Bacillota bacterium]